MNSFSKTLPTLLVLLLGACENKSAIPQTIAPKAASIPAEVKSESIAVDDQKLVAKQSATAELTKKEQFSDDSNAFTCPAGSLLIPGGIFFVGNAAKTYEQEENPRFSTAVSSFCADITEVTAAAYEKCVASGACSPSRGKNRTCNSVAKGRGDHPINCIDFKQAEAVCESRTMRLPTEIEWEYLGRGGSRMLRYPWGNEHPEGRNCWKNNRSCKVASFAPDHFGLYDVVGNVWEWTSSYFAPYPWPAAEGRHRIFRGASWSRRFEKWLRPNLRNRLKESGSGSHLGVRCVSDGPEACHYGQDDQGDCLFGVEQVQCLGTLNWNGARCAPPDAKKCPSGAQLLPGRGCVKPKVKGRLSQKLDLSGISTQRSPSFDEDCASHTPKKPRAYRLSGGGHLGRNEIGRQRGCKNRDVGVGWNSACCP